MGSGGGCRGRGGGREEEGMRRGRGRGGERRGRVTDKNLQIHFMHFEHFLQHAIVVCLTE